MWPDRSGFGLNMAAEREHHILADLFSLLSKANPLDFNAKKHTWVGLGNPNVQHFFNLSNINLKFPKKTLYFLHYSCLWSINHKQHTTLQQMQPLWLKKLKGYLGSLDHFCFRGKDTVKVCFFCLFPTYTSRRSVCLIKRGIWDKVLLSQWSNWISLVTYLISLWC